MPAQSLFKRTGFATGSSSLHRTSATVTPPLTSDEESYTGDELSEDPSVSSDEEGVRRSTLPLSARPRRSKGISVVAGGVADPLVFPEWAGTSPTAALSVSPGGSSVMPANLASRQRTPRGRKSRRKKKPSRDPVNLFEGEELSTSPSGSGWSSGGEGQWHGGRQL